MTDRVVEQLNEVKERMEEEQRRVNETRNRILDSYEQFKRVRFDVQILHSSLTNLKYYGIGIAVSLTVSFVVAHVFIPTLALTGLFLFVEVILRFTHPWFKWGYVGCCLLVHFVGIWRAILPLRRRFRGRGRAALVIPPLFGPLVRCRY
jgi:bacteriorhodopsin